MLSAIKKLGNRGGGSGAAAANGAAAATNGVAATSSSVDSPQPMSSALQKKFAKGRHVNILS